MPARIIAVIPARGGSKRLLNKNILGFHGKPMIAWTIEAALASKKFDRVIVTTDSAKIAGIALKYGAEVPFMREKYSDDRSPVSLATLDAIHRLGKNEKYDIVVQLMANCPLRTASNIRDAIGHFISQRADFQISCFKYGWMNPWWACRVDKTGRGRFLFEEALKKRSQDLPELYCPTGAIWIARVERFKKAKTFYGPRYRLCEMPWHAAIDVDDAADLKMALAAYWFSGLKEERR